MRLIATLFAATSCVCACGIAERVVEERAAGGEAGGGKATGGGSAAGGGLAGRGGASSSSAGAPAFSQAGASAQTCPAVGLGSVTIAISGVPRGLANVTVDGPTHWALSESESLTRIPAGTYRVAALPVADADPIVRTVFEATVTPNEAIDANSFCLHDGESLEFRVAYAAIPSSNRLWTTSVRDTDLLGFASQQLAKTGQATGVPFSAGAEVFAFDRRGNYWAQFPAGSSRLARFDAADFAAPAPHKPAAGVELLGLDCVPPIRDMAFDLDGNLWLSSCGTEVRMLPAAALTGGPSATPLVRLSGLSDAGPIAFDLAGNLWVGDGPNLARFSVNRPEATIGDREFSGQVKLPSGTPLQADALAFDRNNAQLGVDRNGWIFRISFALDFMGSATVDAEWWAKLPTGSQPNRPAFDESGGLWLSLVPGSFGRYSSEQLSAHPPQDLTQVTTPAVTISGANVGAGTPLALFPAPPGLPLYHAFPGL